MKKSMNVKAALFVMLAAISILPGCGKKNNDSGAAGVGGVAAVYGISNINGSSCVSAPYNTAVTVTFYGTLTPSSGIRSLMAAYSAGSNTGGFASGYYRTNMYGDSLNVYVSGNQAYAVVTFAAVTVNAIIAGQGAYSGYGQICGLNINASIYNPAYTGSAWSGTIGGGEIAPLGQGGSYIYSGGTKILL